MLEQVSTNRFKHTQNLYPRRFHIMSSESISHNMKLYFHGAPLVGKTSLALFYAKNFHNPFYIDFKDIRNSIALIADKILHHSWEKVDLLILDNIPQDWNLFPKTNIIAIAESESALDEFINRKILALNFSEFIGINMGSQSVPALFDGFIKYGNLPFMQTLKDVEKIEYKQKMLSLIFGSNLDIFAYLCGFQGKCVTPHQLYTMLKRKRRTSKDSIYALLSHLEARGLIYFVPHFCSRTMPKKLFLWDFSIANALSYEKDFTSSIANMVFLELLARNSPIFYSEKIHLICENIGYIIAPFNTIEHIKTMLSSLDTLDLDIIVITFNISEEIRINNKIVIIKKIIHFVLDE